ncbi:MAG: hypothetical protein ACXVEW_10135, partial [Solirubrobacteraceae bacterium]
MTGQLHHLIAQQQIADAHKSAAMARILSGEQARRRVRRKPIAALLAVCGIACIVGASARAMPQTTKAPGAECRIKLPISLTADSRHSPGRRYVASGPAACTGWLGPWFSTGGSGSASSSGAVILSEHGARGCVPSVGHGRVFAVVPRQAWFVSPEVTVSG